LQQPTEAFKTYFVTVSFFFFAFCGVFRRLRFLADKFHGKIINTPINFILICFLTFNISLFTIILFSIYSNCSVTSVKMSYTFWFNWTSQLNNFEKLYFDKWCARNLIVVIIQCEHNDPKSSPGIENDMQYIGLYIIYRVYLNLVIILLCY